MEKLLGASGGDESGNVVSVATESALGMILGLKVDKLIVVNFTSSKCPPCIQVAPAFRALAAKYKAVSFIEVDIQSCPSTASTHGVNATPTFLLFKNKDKLDSVRGGNIESLEAKIQMHMPSEGSQPISEVPSHIDLITLINKNGCECLNENDSHPHTNIFDGKSKAYLESDADEQLILTIDFTETVKIHSLRIKGPQENGPKKIKLFVNQPFTLDFQNAEQGDGADSMEITPEQLDGELIPLKFAKFQKVMALNIFVENNQGDTDITRIDYLQVFGSPTITTNMSDFKRIAGKKGESH